MTTAGLLSICMVTRIAAALAKGKPSLTFHHPIECRVFKLEKVGVILWWHLMITMMGVILEFYSHMCEITLYLRNRGDSPGASLRLW